MGGFFGAASKKEVLSDVFFGTDYHSHLGIKRGGLAVYDKKTGLQRQIKNVENAPFRTKFDHVFDEMSGKSAIGCISDTDPQPLLIRSKLGVYAICIVGIINNSEELIKECLEDNICYFDAMTGGKVNSTELVAALINQKPTFVEGIKYAQSVIDGSASILILQGNGSIIAARDKFGRTPIHIGKNEDGYCAAFESFACQKVGYNLERELGPGEIVEFDAENLTQLSEPGKEMKMCAFLWTYYGYPNSIYEGVNVEVMRNRNGRILAQYDKEHKNVGDLDYVSGVPDSGTPHAIGYANESGVPFGRPFIKYTPTWARSFTPPNQAERDRVAKMKQLPIHDLIIGKKLLFVDDSIVRGTQLKETVDFLYNNGAQEVHMRSACPPVMYGCKYLNFSRSTSDMELIARRIIVELEGEEGLNYIEQYSDSSTERGKTLRKTIAEKFKFASLEFQSLEGTINAIGIDPCKLCTYCWNGKG